MLHLLLEETTEEERRSLIKTLNASTATRKDTKRLIVGQKEVERSRTEVEIEKRQGRTQEGNS